NENGYLYYHNKNAWITKDIFRKYFTMFNRRMRNLNRKVIVLLDNASCHADVDNYSNIAFFFLPANTTTRYQPLDAGMIQNFKTFYM
ncbi:CENP-B protein, partial [Backusella circina FSU 941]